jgi:alpha-amylase
MSMKRVRRVMLALAVFGITCGGLSARADLPAFQMAKHPMIYFVMLDRFANGDPANDHGYISGGATKDGFNPSATGFYHGGDLAGLTSKIGYIKSLGFTAIWVTPVVRQVTVAPDGSSAGYHGYWGAGFDQVDPHLGSMQDFKDFVTAAHGQGLGVILDIVANHTGDVIYSSGGTSYSDTYFSPYLTKAGKVFSASKLAGSSKFPTLSQLDPYRSFPNPPLLNNSDARIKSPAWLNDVRNYHNRGNSSFTGESSLLGDFYGLDDLFTESPVVVNGMIKIFADWITNTGVDGFRVDTARHVNKEFWRAFLPAMRQAAKDAGKTNFPMWGEVYDANVSGTSYWVKNASFNEVLDFPLQNQLLNFVNTGASDGLVSVFNNDDVYATSRSDADGLITFLGNHDMGRVGSFIGRATSSKSLQLSRDTLAHALLFTLRGNPAVYYGDEFGLQGGGDQVARQDLFPTQVSQWKAEPRIGGSTIGAGSSFDTTNPLQTSIADLATLRASNDAFGDGQQIIRAAGNGLFVFSRINSATGTEFVCAFNAGTSDSNQEVPVSTTTSNWSRVLGQGTAIGHTDSARLQVQLPAGTWGVFKPNDGVLQSETSTISMSPVVVNPTDSGQYRIQASTGAGSFTSVRFYQKPTHGTWTYLGSDHNPYFATTSQPTSLNQFRLFVARTAYASRTTYAFKAVVTTPSGKQITSKLSLLKIK